MADQVALLTESVDWNNIKINPNVHSFIVALLTESVDWNLLLALILVKVLGRSPHGERGLKSWRLHSNLRQGRVALLTESVDWNVIYPKRFASIHSSLSSRRAWIEIEKTRINPQKMTCRSPHGERGLKWGTYFSYATGYQVALLTESVDWN